MPDVYVGRQPIYNRQLKVIAYELLFRDLNRENTASLDGDNATMQVILNSFMEIGLDELVGGSLAFINMTRSFIVEQYPIPLDAGRVVLEVLEDIEIDKEITDALSDLAERGFQLALDDVVDPWKIEPLLDMVNIIKIDLMEMDRNNLPAVARQIERFKKVRFLAEKVETHEEFEMCMDMGFHYFQGYYFSKPHIVKGKKIPESRFAVLQLLSQLQKPGVEFKEMEDIIRQDVSVSYRLLKLVNSSYYARPKKIDSIRQALTLLGLRQIRDWVSLLALSKVDDKPRELMITAMVRGKMMENIANKLKLRNSESGFTVGLFSVLDALLDMPYEQILENISLSAELEKALLKHEGTLGKILESVLAYERGDWDKAKIEGVSVKDTCDLYVNSVSWTNAVSSAV